MAEFEPRPLHLHTLDSLIADLMSGRPILKSDGLPFTLYDAATRSALYWYRSKGQNTWTASVTASLAEDLVNTVLKPSPGMAALPARPPNANTRRLTLKKVEAHRFAGLHKFGTAADA